MYTTVLELIHVTFVTHNAECANPTTVSSSCTVEPAYPWEKVF